MSYHLFSVEVASNVTDTLIHKKDTTVKAREGFFSQSLSWPCSFWPFSLQSFSQYSTFPFRTWSSHFHQLLGQSLCFCCRTLNSVYAVDFCVCRPVAPGYHHLNRNRFSAPAHQSVCIWVLPPAALYTSRDSFEIPNNKFKHRYSFAHCGMYSSLFSFLMQSLTMLSGNSRSHLRIVSVCNQICNSTNDRFWFSKAHFQNIECTLVHSNIKRCV